MLEVMGVVVEHAFMVYSCHVFGRIVKSLWCNEDIQVGLDAESLLRIFSGSDYKHSVCSLFSWKDRSYR